MSTSKIRDTPRKCRSTKNTDGKDTTDQGQATVRVPVTVKPNSNSTTSMILVPEEKWERINEQLQKIDKLETHMEKICQITARFVELEEAMAFQNKLLEDLRKENATLKSEILDCRIQAKLHADKNEQYSRRENIRISGVVEENNENLDEIVKSLSTHLEVELKVEEISACHRVGQKKPNVSRPILLKLSNRRKKEDILKAAKSKAKGKPALRKVYFNEDLTDIRSKMCAYARKCSQVRNVATHNGKIICYLHEKSSAGRNKTVLISSPEDLAKLSGDPVSTVLKKINLLQE